MTEFLLRALSIVLIDVLLAGDNAVMIALAVRGLPAHKRRIGIAAGSTGAVLLRVLLTFFASKLLSLPYLRLVGGVMVLWIAVKLLLDAADVTEATGKSARSLWQAVWLILIADLTMSLDNILAVAAASKGDFRLMIFGLALSIPLVVITSGLLSGLMQRFPVIVYIGAAILGRVGGEMVVADFGVSLAVGIGAEFAGATGVLLVGQLLIRRAKTRASAPGADTTTRASSH